jgi:hypothetical protein
MREQLLYLQSLGLSQVDWSSILFLIVAGTLYVVAPPLGYVSSKRRMLAASMWAMIGKLAIAIFRQCLFSLEALGGPAVGNNWNVTPVPAPTASRGNGVFGAFDELLPVLLALAETVAFLAAIILFVFGIQRLVRREPVPMQPHATERPGQP